MNYLMWNFCYHQTPHQSQNLFHSLLLEVCENQLAFYQNHHSVSEHAHFSSQWMSYQHNRDFLIEQILACVVAIPFCILFHIPVVVEVIPFYIFLYHLVVEVEIPFYILRCVLFLEEIPPSALASNPVFVVEHNRESV